MSPPISFSPLPAEVIIGICCDAALEKVDLTALRLTTRFQGLDLSASQESAKRHFIYTHLAYTHHSLQEFNVYKLISTSTLSIMFKRRFAQSASNHLTYPLFVRRRSIVVYTTFQAILAIEITFSKSSIVANTSFSTPLVLTLTTYLRRDPERRRHCFRIPFELTDMQLVLTSVHVHLLSLCMILC